MSAKLTDAGAMVVGVAGSRYLKTTLEKQPKITPKVNALIRLGVGVLLPSIAGGKKSQMVTNVANGVIADAATSLAASFGMPGISGTNGDDSISYAAAEDYMSGTSAYNSISGND